MNISKSIVKFFVPVSILLSVVGCSGNTGHDNTSDTNALSPQQEALVADGWYIPKTTPAGELSKEYGIKDKYGQQDNYFDIQIGNGCDVAVKIVDAVTDKCIRYVFVLENSTENIQMIPQGKYYLKLAYGKDWNTITVMEQSRVSLLEMCRTIKVLIYLTSVKRIPRLLLVMFYK